MNASMITLPRRAPAAALLRPPEARLPLALSARVTNIVYTAQVQVAYACASQARQSAERAIASIEASLPASPLREMLLNLYRAQKDSADAMAQQLLENARQRCGLAYANYGYLKP
jgi:hypothetical protein